MGWWQSRLLTLGLANNPPVLGTHGMGLAVEIVYHVSSVVRFLVSVFVLLHVIFILFSERAL